MGSRFGWAVGLGAAVFALVGGLTAQAKPAWDDVGYNAGHTGIAAKEKTINSKTTVHLANAGSFTSNGPVIYQPVISGGMIYFRSGDGNLYADDMTTGQTVWSQPISSPNANWGEAVNKDRLVVNCVTTGNVNGLCAYDPKTGKKLWTYALDNGGGYSPPTIDGNAVYFLSSGNEKNDSVNGQHLVAVNLKDGSEIWRQWYCDDFSDLRGVRRHAGGRQRRDLCRLLRRPQLSQHPHHRDVRVQIERQASVAATTRQRFRAGKARTAPA